MKLLPRAVAAAGLGLIVGSASADIVPAVKVEQSYTDNVYRQPGGSDEQSSWVTVVNPGVALEMQKGASKFELGANTEAGLYTVDTRNNYVDWSGYGKADVALNARNAVSASLNHGHKHDEIGTARTEGASNWRAAVKPDELDEYDQTDANLKYGFGAKTARARIVVQDFYMNKDYTTNRAQTRNFARTDNELRGTGYWRIMPKTSLLLEGRDKDINYLHGSLADNTEKRLYAGAEWEATAKTTGAVRLGRLNKDFSSASGLASYDINSWEATITWQPRSYSSFVFDTSRGTTESMDAGVAYIDREDYSLTWNHDWSSRISSKTYVEHYTDDYLPSLPARKDKVNRLGTGASYKLNSWALLKADYAFEDRSSSYNVKEFTRNLLTLGVEMKFDQ